MLLQTNNKMTQEQLEQIVKNNNKCAVKVFTHRTCELAGSKVTAAPVLLLNTSEIHHRNRSLRSRLCLTLIPNYLWWTGRNTRRQKGSPCSPVDGITGEAVSLVTAVTGAVDEQSRLVTVCVRVTAAVVLRAEIRSCFINQSSARNTQQHLFCVCVGSRLTHPSYYIKDWWFLISSENILHLRWWIFLPDRFIHSLIICKAHPAQGRRELADFGRGWEHYGPVGSQSEGWE